MFESTFIGGIALGLASALHCSAMCGGIACGANMLLNKSARRGANLALMQLGRITTYVAIGTAVAFLGSGVFPERAAHSTAIVQWASAFSLMWIGLVVAGAAPRLAMIDEGMLRVASQADRIFAPFRKNEIGGPIAVGILWGLNACPMVYGAAFLASVSGSASKGAVFMAGFGLGTVPAIIASAAGITFIRRLGVGPRSRLFAGIAIAAVGVALAHAPMHLATTLFCIN